MTGMAEGESGAGFGARPSDRDALTPMDCEHCVFYIYDEESDVDLCQYDFDEDELARFREARSGVPVCPYFRLYDEYGTVRKQM